MGSQSFLRAAWYEGKLAEQFLQDIVKNISAKLRSAGPDPAQPRVGIGAAQGSLSEERRARIQRNRDLRLDEEGASPAVGQREAPSSESGLSDEFPGSEEGCEEEDYTDDDLIDPGDYYEEAGEPINKLLIYSLPDIEKDDVETIFAQFGEVVSCAKLNSGRALVFMKHVHEARWMVTNLHKSVPQGLVTPIGCVYATPENIRRSRHRA